MSYSSRMLSPKPALALCVALLFSPTLVMAEQESAVAYAQVKGRKMAYVMAPAENNAEYPYSLVLISGGGEDKSAYEDALPLLAKSARTIVYDRFGYGDSDKPPSGKRDAAALSAELQALLDEINLPRPIVIGGHSLGGLVAEYYANTHPEDIAGLILIDSHASDYYDICMSLYDRKVCDFPWWAKALTFLKPVLRKEVDALATSRDEVAALGVQMSAPTLVLTHSQTKRTSEQERVWKLSQVSLVKKYGAKQVIVPDAGHNIQKDQPIAFANEIEVFLSSITTLQTERPQ